MRRSQFLKCEERIYPDQWRIWGRSRCQKLFDSNKTKGVVAREPGEEKRPGWTGKGKWARTWGEGGGAKGEAGKLSHPSGRSTPIGVRDLHRAEPSASAQAFMRPRSINSRLERSKPSSAPFCKMGCVFTQRTKRAMPSSRGTFGENANNCPMAEISAKLWRI